jgi:endonuclease/exonuclease/phosphatase family metal-dependent hydrolase
MQSPKGLFRSAIALSVFLVIACVSVATASDGTSVKVMTYNLDEGTDFDAIIAVLTSPNPTAAAFETAVAQTIAEVQNSHPEIRANLIAKAIASAQPDLVGLQEAAVWTSPAIPGGTLDLLQMVMANLPNYTPVVIVPEFQINIAQLGVGFTDQDVILARTDLLNAITKSQSGHYSHLIPLPALLPYLSATHITRGWAYVEVLLGGTKFRFVTTHLEDGTVSLIFALVQAQQEIELISGPASTALPVIVAGDFNTVANNPFSPTFLTYSFMLNNGFTDAWSRTHPFRIFSGATCCQDNLQDSTPHLTQRLDQVFVRNQVSVVGAQLVDQFDLASGFWPSDHAAVLVGAIP